MGSHLTDKKTKNKHTESKENKNRNQSKLYYGKQTENRN
uniref:Uncharacterized protein n=1 Tax=Rhizophora mucronata TaxID=61149 RepID=A0A2P2PLJ6_RHIMU